jgi:branched-chain amino acid transport system permease protein
LEIAGQVLVSGLLVGGVYGLSALGLTLVFGVLRVINFAHGAFLMIAMFLTYWSWTLFGIDPYVSLVLVVPTMFVLGAIIERLVIEQVIDAREENQLLATMGLALILVNGAQVLWATDFRILNVSYASAAWLIGGISVSVPRLIAFVGAIALSLLVYTALRTTFVGKQVQAVAEDPQSASLVGINLARVRAATFGLGAACVGVAGTLLTPFATVSPIIGERFTLLSFVVVVLGGLGNAAGALVAGLMVGVAEAVGAIVLPGSMKELLIFVVFILTLILRPQGLFGRKATVVG